MDSGAITSSLPPAAPVTPQAELATAPPVEQPESSERETLTNGTSHHGDELPMAAPEPVQLPPSTDTNAPELMPEAPSTEVIDSTKASQSIPLQPIEHTSQGPSALADFLPADANLRQPTPSPSEPLAEGARDVDMVDVEAAIPADPVEDSKPEAALTSTLATQPEYLGKSTTSDTPAPLTSTLATQPEDLGKSTTSDTPAPLTNGTTAQDTSSNDVHLPPAPPAPTPAVQSETTEQKEIPGTNTSVVDPGPTQPSSTPFQSTSAQVDTQMADAAPTLVRSREEDANDEPSAKRFKHDLGAQESSIGASSADTTVPAIPTEAAQADNGTSAATSAPASVPPASQPISASGLAPQTAVNGNTLGHLPARPSYSTEPLTKVQKKLLEEKMKNTRKVKSAGPFLQPVDPVALNIPHYTNIIVSPMDLATIEQKLKTDQYTSLEAFVSDFELMINNCFTFNGPAHAVSGMAQNLRAYFLKQMDSVPTGEAAMAAPKLIKRESPVAKPQPRREVRVAPPPPVPAPAPVVKSPSASADTFSLLPGGVPQIRRDSTAGRPKRTVIPPASRDLPYSGVKPKRKENQAGLKFCDHILEEVRKPRYHNMTMFFLEPVDPVALNIPHYFSIVKHPMDISTITNKQKTGQYSSADEFKADFDLMLQNCFKFNPADNGVHIAGKQLQGEFEALWKGKNEWVKKNAPRSQRVTPTSDVDSSDEESSDDEADEAEDNDKATIRALKEQLANMQNILGQISGVKRDSPKASGKKKSRSGGGSKSKKGGALPAAKGGSKSAKPKKQRLVSYEEKQEISSATEQMTPEQTERLTQIITENVAKYKNMGDDMELEIDDLPNDVQHKLLKYVRTIFPSANAREDSAEDPVADDDDYAPAAGGGGGAMTKSGKRKHKPMKKAEQESRIAQLSAKVEALKGGLDGAGPGAGGHLADSSGDEDSESSEEE